MPYITINGLKAYYAIHPSKKPIADTIVLIHGFALDSSLWRSMLAHLQERYQILIYDMRGHGLSDQGDLELSWDILCDDLYHLVRVLKISHFYLTGYGFGAHLAALFTSRYPKSVLALFMISLPFMRQSGHHYQLMSEVFPYIKKALESGKNNYLSPFEYIIQQYTTLEPYQTELDHYFRVLSSFPDQQYAQVSELTLHSPLMKSLLNIRVPSLSISGKHGSVVPTELDNIMSFSLHQHTQLTMSNASFLLILEQPELTANWIDFYIQYKINQEGFLKDKDNINFNVLYEHLFNPGTPQEVVPIIEVKLINRFEVRIGGYLVTKGWNKRYATRLFIYLLFHPSTTREKICDALFPNVPLNKALNNVKVYLNHLNSILKLTGNRHVLHFSRGNVRMQYKVKCDLFEFREWVHQAYHEKNEEIRFNLCQSLLNQFQYPLSLDIYDEWLVRTIEQLEHQLIELNQWMAHMCLKKGKHAQAVDYLTNLFHFQPLEVEVLEQIINIYGQLNNSYEQNHWKQRLATIREQQ